MKASQAASFDMPIVPYLNAKMKSWCRMWAVARCFDIGLNHGSGKVHLSTFRKWLKLHGWSNPSRFTTDLCSSPFTKLGTKGECAYLFSKKAVVQFLVKMNIKDFGSVDQIRIFTGMLTLGNCFKSSDFTRWYVRAIAALPQYWKKTVKSPRGSFHPWHCGRSRETLATMAGVSVGWLIKLTKDLRVQNYEMVTMPSDPHLEGSVRMELGNRLRALFHLGGHDYLFQGPNTYRTDTLYRRCSLFTISRDGRCDFEREYGIRIGGNLWIEKSKSPEVYHQPNPETRRLFRMQ